MLAYISKLSTVLFFQYILTILQNIDILLQYFIIKPNQGSTLTLILLVANLANTEVCKNPEK